MEWGGDHGWLQLPPLNINAIVLQLLCTTLNCLKFKLIIYFVEEFFPDFHLEVDSGYFVTACKNLTEVDKFLVSIYH